MSDRTFHIRPVLDGQTLAGGLRVLIAELSWAEARRLIHNRHVQVNGNLVTDEARRLKSGDVVKLFDHPRAPVPTDQDVRVVYVDDDLIIVDKPAGITTLRHAEEKDWDDRRKQRQPTLDEVVQRILPAALQAGRKGNAGPASGQQRKHVPGGSPAGVIRRPGGQGGHSPGGGIPKVRPVHRLDRDTSGLMLFALSVRAEQALVQMFKDHTIDRTYQSVVMGKVQEPMRMESWFIRDRGDGLRGSTPSGKDEPDSQHAVTHVEPIGLLAGGQYSMVRCKLETGRTHQIRIHLAEAGHMLCGERTYTSPKAGQPPVSDESGAPRQALHSADLQLTHPISGQVLKFHSPLAKDLKQWLGRLERP